MGGELMAWCPGGQWCADRRVEHGWAHTGRAAERHAGLQRAFPTQALYECVWGTWRTTDGDDEWGPATTATAHTAFPGLHSAPAT